ncbi:MAG: hypothetical protein II961_09835 [Candidatus Riflebacteria bacterium]|nr:hypothetical protein [Candidatus Riflebacteria bacterium]
MKQKTILVLLISIICFTSTLFATDSQNKTQKAYAPIEVSLGSGKDAKRYLLMNNGLDINRWYYASLNPKLYEYGSPIEPDLMMIKYQRLNKDKKGKLDEGALFHCSFDIGADEEVLKKLKKYLPKEIDQNKVRLSVIPLEGIELSFISPNNKNKEISIIATNTSNIVPLEGSKVSFDTVLDKNSTVIVDTLLNTTVGIEYSIKYHYSIYSNPIKKTLTAKVNRNKIVISGYSDNDEPNLQNYIKSKEKNPKFLQLLKSNYEKELKQKSNTSSSSKDEEEDLKDVGHKKKVDPTKISDYSLNDFQTYINFTYRIREDKIHAASGFITLSNYDKDIVKKKVIQDTSYLEWNYAYIVMPNFNDKVTKDVNQINMLVELMFKNKVIEKRNYIWNKDKGWRNIENDYPATVDKFNLNAIYAESSSSQLKNAKFRINTNIEFEEDPDIKTQMELPVTNGEIPITTPFAFCNIAEFDFTNLFWDGLKTDKTRLVSMEINLKDENRKIKRIVQPITIKGTKAIETPSFMYLLTKLNSFNDGKMKASIYFKTADGKKIPWEYNDLVLNKYMSTPYFMFFDEEWKGK